MTEVVDKVIVTVRTALAAKYGDGLDQIEQALQNLVGTNEHYGLSCRVVELDDEAAMGELGAPVVNSSDPAQVKAAIDGVYTALAPDYLMILGAPDVVPHVPLKNPMFSGPNGGDPDEFAYGDVPYACEAGYSDDPADFVGPTRVVGRLPDINGGTDPAYLVGLLENATHWHTSSREDYAKYLGITAKVWTGSTTLSMQSVFGAADDLKTAPPDGPNWPPDLLGRLSHFINCHGADSDDHFYGQEDNSYPVSVDAKLIDGQISVGTVVAAECCYGAQLYDPTGLSGPGICNIYLGNRAFGFWGSSTIAYGPADSNGSADYMCQFFLLSMLTGASLGRAALEARQRFVQQVTTVDPADLKTLAQYSLLGDPSIHPVRVAHDVVPVAAPGAKAIPVEALGAPGRAARRANLAAIGLGLRQSTSVAVEAPATTASADIVSELLAAADEPALEGATVKTFDAGPPSIIAAEMHAMVAAPQTQRLHLAVGRREHDTRALDIVAVIGREEDGRIVEIRKLYGR